MNTREGLHTTLRDEARTALIIVYIAFAISIIKVMYIAGGKGVPLENNSFQMIEENISFIFLLLGVAGLAGLLAAIARLIKGLINIQYL